MKLRALLLGLAAALAPAGAAAQALEVAVTVDDLPVHGPLPPGETRLGVAQGMIDALKAAKVPSPYGFINAAYLESEPETAAVLEAWRAAGFPLGNHGWSHKSLDSLDAAAFLEEIRRNEPALKRLSRGKDWRWFRYPFLHEGQDPAKRMTVRRHLASNGYRIAAVTMSYADYEWNHAYARCRTKNDAAGIERLEAGYLEAVRSSILQGRARTQAAYGRDVPHVLLTHISPFNARMFARVLDVYRKEGFRFVTLKKAQRDPVYRADMRPSLPPAPSIDSRLAAVTLPAGYDARPLLESVCR